MVLAITGWEVHARVVRAGREPLLLRTREFRPVRISTRTTTRRDDRPRPTQESGEFGDIRTPRFASADVTLTLLRNYSPYPVW